MRAEVTHVAPLFFGEDGLWGGGERYVLELGRAMATRVPTRLVTFGPRRRRLRLGQLRIDVLPVRSLYKGHEVNPLSELTLTKLVRTNVVHSHHYESVLANMCVVGGRALGKPVFVTDHGGRGRNYATRFRLDRLVSGYLPVSRHAACLNPRLAPMARAVYGGVDTTHFTPGDGPRERHALYVGRMLWFKGVAELVSAIAPDIPLRLVGPAYDEQYRLELERLALEKQVQFVPPPSQAALLDEYRRARVLVVPSVYDSAYSPDGSRAPGELFPLVILEAMACGTPVVCTDVGGMPEAVRDGENGFVVPASDPQLLDERVRTLLDDDAVFRRMSACAQETVSERFTWDAVAERCLDAYASRA